MFTWICPKCGGEVPPAYDDCPRCSPPKKANPPVAVQPTAPPESSELPATQAPPPPPPPVREATPPPVYAAPEQPLESDAPPPRRAVVYAPPEKKGLSPTLVGLLAGLGIAGLLAVLYLYVLPRTGAGEDKAGTQEKAALETPGPAGSGARTHPLAKHLEVTGVRLKDFKNGKAIIQFVVVNHSAASLPEMTMDVKIISGGKTFFEIPAQLPSLGPYEVKDLSSPVATELKGYEMPDWQMIRPQFSLRAE